MKQLANDLRAQVEISLTELRRLTEVDVTASRGPGKWIGKEILGHLIDSAANNHQRFVRAPFDVPFVWPGYEQNAWVSAQRYRDRPWTELVELWAALNRHVAYAVEAVPASALQTRCTIGGDEPVTLDWLMRDYLRHLRHHLAQILPPRT